MKSFKKSFLYTLLSRIWHTVRVRYWIKHLEKRQWSNFEGNDQSNLIASLTSFPARIEHVWITIESLFQQSYKPWKVVLVLAEEEFPGKKLPKTLEDQVDRGLEIIWVSRNTRSFKKLLPVKEKYPSSYIVTFDDDIIYETKRTERLVRFYKSNPGCIVACRGKEVLLAKQGFMPYMEWPMANRKSPDGKVLATGVGGILYPPGLLNEQMLLDIDNAQRLTPTADDIWFWATAVYSNVPVRCLAYNRTLSIKFRDSENGLTRINCIEGRNDIQLRAIDEEYKISAKIRHEIEFKI